MPKNMTTSPALDAAVEEWQDAIASDRYLRASDTARKHGILLQSFYSRLRRLGLPTVMVNAIDEAMADLIAINEGRAPHRSLAAVARARGLARQSVWMRAYRRGIPAPKPEGRKK